MIKLDFLKCSDINRLGEYSFYLNHLTIGSSLSDQFVVHSDNKKKISFSIEITSEQKIFLNPSAGSSFLVNGKRFQAKKRLSIEDIFEIDKNKIKLKAAQFEQSQSAEDFINNKLEKLKQEKSPLLKLLKELQQ